MPVYVDKAKNHYKRMIMCHLLADTLEELHTFAKQIGLKREWFQNGSTPHYDLSLTKRKRAIQNGAIEIDNRKVVEIIHKYRQNQQT